MGKTLGYIISQANSFRRDIYQIAYTGGDESAGGLYRPTYGQVVTGTSGFAGTVVGYTLASGVWAHATHTAAGYIYVLNTGTVDYVVGDTLTGGTLAWTATGGAITQSDVLSKYPAGVGIEYSQWQSVLSSAGAIYDKGTNMLKAGIYNLYVVVMPDGALSGEIGILGA